MHSVNILLVHLGSYGDCLIATIVARQIKEIDFPDCKLTWLIGSKFRAAIENNPYIDEIIEIPILNVQDLLFERGKIETTIEGLIGNFDEIFITDHNMKNDAYWYGTTRSSILRTYPYALKIDIKSIIELTEVEKNNVKLFCEKNKISMNTFNILFESSPQSMQSNITNDLAIEISDEIIKRQKGVKIIISSSNKIQTNNECIIDGSDLAWRENAELVNYCSLLIGCSSGITWLSLSKGIKDINMLQILNPDYWKKRISASVKNDLLYFGMSTDRIIEMYNPEKRKITECIMSIINNGFGISKIKYDCCDYYMFLDKRVLCGTHERYRKNIEKELAKVKYIRIEILRRLKPFIEIIADYFGKLLRKSKRIFKKLLK